MMRRTWWIALLVMAGCARKPVQVQIDSSLATLVPPDTVIMVGTRLDSLVKTPVYQKNFAGKPLPQIEEFASRTGIDPRKDLWELLYVSNGHDGVLLGRGKFADEMEEPDSKKEGVQRFGYKGFKMLGDERTAVLFVNSTTAAIGPVPALHALIDQRADSHGPPPALATLIAQIPPNAQFWGAYAGGPIHLPFDADSNLGNVNKLLGSVQNGIIYFDLRSGLTGVASASCADEAGAQQVYGALKAIIGLGRLSVPKNQPDLAQAYDSIRVTQEASQVKLHVDVSQEVVDKFLAVWLGRR
jgi:hypothetical protein